VVRVGTGQLDDDGPPDLDVINGPSGGSAGVGEPREGLLIMGAADPGNESSGPGGTLSIGQ